jgi:hypothetical protein
MFRIQAPILVVPTAEASVHGCYREFKHLLDVCSDHADGKPARLITLGDYVDRGPDSYGVVQLIRHHLAGEYPIFQSIINLKGNHENMMVRAVLGGELSAKQNWVSSDNGGAPHEKYVVHGHTPVRKPDVQANRINIDTGWCSVAARRRLR